MTPVRTLVALLALIAALVVGCTTSTVPAGRTNAPAPTAPPRVPSGTGAAGSICYLVTDAEVERVMGKPPLSGGGSGFELGGDRFCTWILYMDPIESVGLLLNRAANHEPGRFDGAETVPGLGQDAYWSPSFSGLDVLTGPYNLHVSVDSESRNEKDAAVAIARLALSRLR